MWGGRSGKFVGWVELRNSFICLLEFMNSFINGVFEVVLRNTVGGGRVLLGFFGFFNHHDS